MLLLLLNSLTIKTSWDGPRYDNVEVSVTRLEPWLKVFNPTASACEWLAVSVNVWLNEN